MYCLVFKEEEEGRMWKENFARGMAQTSLAWAGHYDDRTDKYQQ